VVAAAVGLCRTASRADERTTVPVDRPDSAGIGRGRGDQASYDDLPASEPAERIDHALSGSSY
jgi:hypothetical protein